MSIKFQRGNLSDLGLASVIDGEPIFTQDQFRLYVGMGGTPRLLALLDNIAATTAPGINDDAGDGYSVGSLWTDTTADNSYICQDSTVGAAVWANIDGAAGGGITELTGDVTAGPGSGSQAATIPNNTITDAKLRDSAALTVIGRSANSSGDPADIAAVAASGSVLRESGSTIGFGTLATAAYANDSVTFAKVQNVSTFPRVLGRRTASAGDIEEMTISQTLDFVTSVSGSMLYRGAGGWSTPLAVGTINQMIGSTGGGTPLPTWRNIPGADTLEATLGGSYTITTSMASTGLSLAVPAGTWFIFAIPVVDIKTSSGVGAVDCQLYNSTDAAILRASHLAGAEVGTRLTGTFPMGCLATFAGTKTVQLRVQMNGSTYTANSIRNDQSWIIAIRLY